VLEIRKTALIKAFASEEVVKADGHTLIVPLSPVFIVL
jgi:hypothetical protein